MSHLRGARLGGAPELERRAVLERSALHGRAAQHGAVGKLPGSCCSVRVAAAPTVLSADALCGAAVRRRRLAARACSVVPLYAKGRKGCTAVEKKYSNKLHAFDLVECQCFFNNWVSRSNNLSQSCHNDWRACATIHQGNVLYVSPN